MSRSSAGRSSARGSAPSPGYARRSAAACLGFATRRPGVVLGVVAVLGCGGAIGWNALSQANRHPAPLFGQKTASRIEAARRADPAATPAPAPVPLPVRRPDPVATLPPSAPPTPPEPPFTKAVAGDPIGAMIRSSDPSLAGESRPDAKLSTAQKALTKLGYGPLRADGLMGATTRQALERFERDHNLPVTGSLGQRTTRQLASAAGTKID